MDHLFFRYILEERASAMLHLLSQSPVYRLYIVFILLSYKSVSLL